MKKLLLCVLSCILVACCSLMVACSSAGTYKFDSLTYSEGGVTAEVKAGEEFFGETLSADYMVLTLNSDGTGTTSSDGYEQDITWTEEDNVIKVVSQGQTINFTKDGNKLSFTMSGMTLILKK